MGSGSFDHRSYATYTSSTRGTSREARFSSREIKKELNPHGVIFRESRDSAGKAASNAIICALDVTGSMGMIAEAIATGQAGKPGQLGAFFTEMYDKQPVTDPHLMFMGIGDINFDRAPLQVSQFEADNRIVEQLTGIWLEGGGGGNAFESYNLAWYFAAKHTSIDCFEKRGKKGYLFTIGDEPPPGTVTSKQISALMGTSDQEDYSSEKLLAMAQRSYHVFHIIIEEGNYARARLPEVQAAWKKLMGQNALSLKDHTKLAQGMVAIIERNEAELGNGSSVAAKELPGYVALLR